MARFDEVYLEGDPTNLRRYGFSVLEDDVEVEAAIEVGEHFDFKVDGMVAGPIYDDPLTMHQRINGRANQIRSYRKREEIPPPYDPNIGLPKR